MGRAPILPKTQTWRKPVPGQSCTRTWSFTPLNLDRTLRFQKVSLSWSLPGHSNESDRRDMFAFCLLQRDVNKCCRISFSGVRARLQEDPDTTVSLDRLRVARRRVIGVGRRVSSRRLVDWRPGPSTRKGKSTRFSHRRSELFRQHPLLCLWYVIQFQQN